MVQCGFHPNMVIPLGPNDSRCNAHHNVQCGPNRGEQVIGWRKGRFVQCKVPIVYRALGGNTRKEPYGQADQNTYGDVKDSFFHGWSNFD